MVKVVTLAVALHHVRAFGVVDVFHAVSRVGGDALAVEPADVGAADAVGGEGAEGGDGHGAGGDAGAVAEDASACRVAEHGVAEAVDEVGRCCCFAEGGNEVFMWGFGSDCWLLFYLDGGIVIRYLLVWGS